MKEKVGLWIDHKKAVVVLIADKKESKVIIKSNLKKNVQSYARSRSSSPYGLRNILADDIKERELKEHLNTYYDKVIPYLRDARSIFIFGPGEAKGELVKRIKNNNLIGSVIKIETIDKMTDRQIIVKVRDYFHNGNRRESLRKTTGRNPLNFHLSRRKSDIV